LCRQQAFADEKLKVAAKRMVDNEAAQDRRYGSGERRKACPGADRPAALRLVKRGTD
jgi:hypothetical protein